MNYKDFLAYIESSLNASLYSTTKIEEIEIDTEHLLPIKNFIEENILKPVKTIKYIDNQFEEVEVDVNTLVEVLTNIEDQNNILIVFNHNTFNFNQNAL